MMSHDWPVFWLGVLSIACVLAMIGTALWSVVWVVLVLLGVR